MPKIALSLAIFLVAVERIFGRGINHDIEQAGERVCSISDTRSGWLTPSFSLEDCVILNGTGTTISDSDSTLLSTALSTASKLTVMILDDCELSDVATVRIVDALGTHGSLLQLSLAGNKITAESANALSRLIETNTKIAVIDLQRNMLMSSGVKTILTSIEDNQGLIELSLNDNGDDVGHHPDEHTDEGGVARSFSGLLYERTDLKVLRIGSTGITYKGVQLIMAALGKNDHLEEFEIGFNNIGPDGGELVGEAIVANKVLKKLIIDGSDIGDDGAAEVSHAFKFNTNVEELSLKSNKLTGIGARYFADVLEEIDWTGLRKLDLGYRGHSITGEWYHYIELLLKAHGSRNSRIERDLLLKEERRRICLLMDEYNVGVDCNLLVQHKHRRVADLLLIEEKDCSDMGLSESTCEKVKLAAQRVERPLPPHIEL